MALPGLQKIIIATLIVVAASCKTRRGTSLDVTEVRRYLDTTIVVRVPPLHIVAPNREIDTTYIVVDDDGGSTQIRLHIDRDSVRVRATREDSSISLKVEETTKTYRSRTWRETQPPRSAAPAAKRGWKTFWRGMGVGIYSLLSLVALYLLWPWLVALRRRRR